MRTGEVASEAAVNIQTLRYYERRGLLPVPPRRESGYRVYGNDAVLIVRFVKRAQELGFSLDEVATLLELAGGGPEACEATQRVAEVRIAELDHRLAELSAMRDSLERFVASWRMPPPEAGRPRRSGMRSGQVARQAGVSIKTLRYYEQRGVLPVPPRRESGYRAYGDEAVGMVRFAKRAQAMALSLDDVKLLFDAYEGRSEACAKAERVANGRLAELDRRARDLRAMRDSLRLLVDTCHSPHRQRLCPLLQSIKFGSTASNALLRQARG